MKQVTIDSDTVEALRNVYSMAVEHLNDQSVAKRGSSKYDDWQSTDMVREFLTPLIEHPEDG